MKILVAIAFLVAAMAAPSFGTVRDVTAAASSFCGYLGSVTPSVDPAKRDDRVLMTRIILSDISVQQKKLEELWQTHLRLPDEKYRLRYVLDCLADLERDVRSALDDRIWVEAVDGKVARENGASVLSAIAELRQDVTALSRN